MGLFALAAAAAFVGRALGRTGGALSPPLDDTYIYLQYARRLAEGHGLSYSGTAAPSTGATSWLHLLLLVPGRWLGLKDALFVLFPLLLGVVYLALTLLGAARAAAAMAPGRGPGGAPQAGGPAGGGHAQAATRARTGAVLPRAAAWAVLGVIGLSGHYLWGAFSGMDTALFGAGLALLLAAVAEPDAARRPAAWLLCGALPWLRPEGALVGVAGAGVLLVMAARDGGAGGRAVGARPRFNLLWPLAALLLGAAPFLLNYAVTGHVTSDGFALKSIFGEARADVRAELWRDRPRVLLEILRLMVSDYRARAWGAPLFRGVLETLFALLSGAGLVAGLGVGLGGRRGAGGVLAALAFLLLVGAGSLSAGWEQHHFRYQVPTFVPAALLMVMGWGALAGRAGRAAPRLFAGLALLTVALQVPGAVKMSDAYAWNCSNIHDQQERVGRWLRANTPPGARVALNDAGAIAYYGERPTLDLLGLTSHGWAATFRAGQGALWERLERLPAAERPDYLAIYPRWFPELTRTDFLATELLKADLRHNTICGDRLKVVYRPDWSWVDRGRAPVARRDLTEGFGMQVLDEVDVGDAASEAAHGYRCRDRDEDLLREYPCGTREGAPVIDGGRRVDVGETFRVKALPHQFLALVARTQSETEMTLEVKVNGRPAGRLLISRQPGVFAEPLLQLPDSLATDSTLTIDVERDPPGAAPGFQSYHYWVLR